METSMKLYWVSAIVHDRGSKPKLFTMTYGEQTITRAKSIIDHLKEYHTVLSAWIDVFDESGVKETVYHDCYIDAFGDFL